MAITPLTPVVSGISLGTAYATIYTVPVDVTRVGIDAVAFNNYSSVNADLSVRIVQSGAGGILNEIITEEPVRAKNNNLGSALIGQAIISGGEIQAKSSVANTINANITVTEISS